MASSTALVSWKDRAERLSTQVKNLREASAAPLRSLMHTASGAMGGVAAGALDAKLPKVGPVPTGPVLGGLMCLAAAANARDDWAHNLNAFGTTLVGVALARATYTHLTAAK